MRNINRTFGYARVSADNQNEGRQIEALTSAGVDERFVLVEKTSGKDTARIPGVNSRTA